MQLYVGDSTEAVVVKKVWRFDPRRIEQYDRAGVEAELVELFPDVARRGLRFDLSYVDDLAGEVSVCSCGGICIYWLIVVLRITQYCRICRRWQLKATEIFELH